LAIYEEESFRERLKSEIWYESTTSRGPGGQNVNKVSSSAILFWNYRDSSLLSGYQKRMISERTTQAVLSAEGWIRIRSDERRDLEANKKNSLVKLFDHLKDWLYVKPRRIPTKATYSSKVKKVAGKRLRGETKRLRGKSGIGKSDLD